MKETQAATLCTLSVPVNPLSSAGLATPWQLGGGCYESNPNQAVFVQAVIFDTATRQLTTYSPLVIDEGTLPAIVPSVLTISTTSVIALFGGGNDDATFLTGSGASSCVNGADGANFGQVFFCNASQFWQNINAAHLSIPSLGIGNDGQPCPTVRSFKIVDQDQSDNVQTTYLVTSSGQTAQNTATNRQLLPGATIVVNPSDNRVLTNFVDPALGCTPWMIPDIADDGNLVPTQATDELQAATYQDNPVALIPSGDPMVGPNVLDMLNAYRQGVDQPQINALGQADTQAYCAHLKDIQPGFLANNQATFTNFPSPVPSIGPNLYAFMQARLTASFQILGCKNI